MSEERDQSIERMLKRGAGAAGRPANTRDCVDGELLAAWTAHSVPAREAARIEQHVADCGRCQAMVAIFTRTEPPPSAVNETWWQRAHLRWLVPVATAAVVVAVWVAVPERANEPTDPVELPVYRERSAPATQAPLASPIPQVQQPFVAGRTNESARSSSPTTKPGNEGRANAAATQQSTALNSAPAPAAPPPAEQPAAVTAQAPKIAAPPVRAEAVGGVSAASEMAGRLAAADVSSTGRTRWRIVDDTQLQRSDDGGVEWHTVPWTPAAPLTAVHAPRADLAWVVGRAGTVYVTMDGIKFERVPFVENVDLVAVTALTERQATVTAADGREWRTVDRGLTWTPR